MKNRFHRFLFYLAAFFFQYAAWAQSSFVADNTRMHVGEILFQQPRTVSFSFTNKGKEPIRIAEVIPSCGCTKVDWPKEGVEPGKKGVITALYDARMLGSFYKELAVYVTGEDEPVYLSMEGRVVTELLDASVYFPIDLGNVRLNTNYVEFDNVNRGDHPVTEFQVVNLGRTPYRPEVMHLPPYLTVESVPEVIPGGKVGRVRLILDSEKLELLGLNQTRIFLSRYRGDKVSETNEILVSAVLLPDFSKLTEEQLKNAPKMNLSAKDMDFGNLKGKRKMTQVVWVTNEGQEPLEIRSVQVFNPAVSVSLNKRKIQPGQTAKMKVTVSADFLKKARIRPRVLLVTNDPQHAMEVINVNVCQ